MFATTREVPAVIDEAVALLACPHCRGALHVDASGLACIAGHHFDVARQGYVTLMSAAPQHLADVSPMVIARQRFLSAGHFDPLARRLSAIVAEAIMTVNDRPAGIVDAGGGTGWWLAHMLDHATRCAASDSRAPAAVGITLDLSRPAVTRAAKAHRWAAAVRCDLWHPWPLRDAVADVVLTVLAPRNPREVLRVLRPDGALIVVTPGPDHLAALVDGLGILGVEPDKRDRLLAQMADGLKLQASHEVNFPMQLSSDAIADVVTMGPSSHHVDVPPNLTEAFAGEVTASFVIDRFVVDRSCEEDGAPPRVG